MRAEIQQAVGLLKSEAENATASKNPLATKLLGVADNLQNVEKDLSIISGWQGREKGKNGVFVLVRGWQS